MELSVKNHWTSTRLVCTLILNPNMTIKTLITKLKKKMIENLFDCRLQSSPTWKRLNGGGGGEGGEGALNFFFLVEMFCTACELKFEPKIFEKFLL